MKENKQNELFNTFGLNSRSFLQNGVSASSEGDFTLSPRHQPSVTSKAHFALLCG